MAFDKNKAPSDFLSPEESAMLSEKKDDIEKLITTPEGQRVKEMIDKNEDSLKKAIEKGDVDTIKNAVSSIMKTDEGLKLADQIMKMLK